MLPNKSPTLSLYLMTMIFILFYVPTSLCDDNQQYVDCGQLFQCRDINANYPFWGGNRPEYCGQPEFQLNCQDNDPPILTIQTRPYRVLSIDNRTQTLTVVREEFWNNTCPRFLYNATLDTNLFNYGSNSKNLRLFYGCSTHRTTSSNCTLNRTIVFSTLESSISYNRSVNISKNSSSSSCSTQTRGGQTQILNQFNCTVNGSTSVNYYATNDSVPGTIDSVTCISSVVVPVFQSAAQGLEGNQPSTNVSTALAGGFELQWTAEDNNCNQCVQSGGRCGYNSSSRSFTCYCSDQAYSLRCNSTKSTQIRNGSRRNIGLKLAIAFSTGLVVIITIVIISCIRRKCLFNMRNFMKKQTLKDKKVEAFISYHSCLGPNRYKYSDIKRMTNSFREKLGQGGFGGVYKGKLSDGRLVAVKLLNETKGSNGEDFLNEVASNSKTSHVNVVTLLGFCYQGQKRALVYEFMPNGSLDKFINKYGCPNTNSHLECKTLYQIAVGIARGLDYLHQGCNTRIVHFDIKPHNILLDEDFCPKISDFGLAKLCQRKESILSTIGARGTVGYIAPEVFCRNFGGVSYKSDVYSYGMMVLEMIGARERAEVGSEQTSETCFLDCIYKHLQNGNDMRLNAVTTEEEKEAAMKMILASLWCIQTNPLDRPTMSKVVEMFEGSLESLQIPPQPYLFSTIRSVQDNSIILSEVLGNQELPTEQITLHQ